MKVAMIGPYDDGLTSGGVEKYTGNLVREIRKIDSDVDMCYIDPLYPKIAAKKIREVNPDLIHLQFCLGLSPWISEEIKHRPIVGTFHELYMNPNSNPWVLQAESLLHSYLHRSQNPTARKAINLLYYVKKVMSSRNLIHLSDRLEHIFVLSEWMGKQMRSLNDNGLPDISVILHPPNIPVSESTQAISESYLKKLGIKKPFFIANPGSPHPWKSYSSIIRSLNFLDELQIIVPGTNLSTLGLRSTYEKNGSSLRFLSFASSMPDELVSIFLQEAQGVLLIYNRSRLFTQSGWAPELLAHGKASIFTQVEPLPEYLNGSGISVKDDPRDIAEAIYKFSDTCLVDEMSTRARNRAEDASWEMTARQTLEVYEKF